MRSPAERRAMLERALRVAAFAALAGLAGAVATRAGAGRRVVIGSGSLAQELPRWTAAPPAGTLVLRADQVPEPALRDWLVALRRAGTRVAWTGSPRPIAASADWSRDPVGVLRVRVAAPPGDSIVLADTLGRLAAAAVSGGGALFELPPGSDYLTVSSGGWSARAGVAARPRARRVAVLGRAGWETRFVVAALEERGWQVDVRATVAPDMAVAQDAPWPPDTARHAAVVALDSLSAAQAAALVEYVRRGGGIVLGPLAAGAPRLAATLAGRLAGRERAAQLAFAAGDPRAALSFERLAPAPAAVALERRSDMVAVAARRVGAGRVVQLGYGDTWRWRLAGGDEAPEQHRAWWAALVDAAAGSEMAAAVPLDAAPLAGLALALGPAVPHAAGTGGRPRWLVPLLFGLLLTALLGEWASRRLRGAA